MSIVVLNEVLDSSRSKGTARLLMVVMAEQAREDGVCWPGVERLALRVNTTPRNIQILTRELEGAGELLVEHSAGRGNTNRYRVLPPLTLNRLIGELTARLEKVKSSAEKVKDSALLTELEKVKNRAEKVNSTSPFEGSEKVKSSAEKVKDSAQKVKSSAEKVKASSPEPSITVNEPLEPTDYRQVVERGQSTEPEIPSSSRSAASGNAPDGATQGILTGRCSPSSPAGQTGQATSLEGFSGGAPLNRDQTLALKALKRAFAGWDLQRLLGDWDGRKRWLDLSPERINELYNDCREQFGRAYRGALADALDNEVRSAQVRTGKPEHQFSPNSPLGRRKYP